MTRWLFLMALVAVSTSSITADSLNLGACDKCAQPIVRCDQWPEKVIHAERCFCTKGHVTYRVK